MLSALQLAFAEKVVASLNYDNQKNIRRWWMHRLVLYSCINLCYL